jgi:hypothetical protein
MAQGNDLPGSETPGPEVSATGGLPADFFEEPARIADDPDGEATPFRGGPLPPRRPARRFSRSSGPSSWAPP